MAFDVRRLRRQRSLFCGILGVSILFGLIWNYSRPRNISSDSSRRTFDVFDPVYGIFPGQRQLSGQSPGRQDIFTCLWILELKVHSTFLYYVSISDKANNAFQVIKSGCWNFCHKDLFMIDPLFQIMFLVLVDERQN